MNSIVKGRCLFRANAQQQHFIQYSCCCSHGSGKTEIGFKMNSDDYRVVFSSFFAKNLKYFLGFSFKIPLLYLWSPLLLNSSNVQKHGQELKKRLVQLVLNLP